MPRNWPSAWEEVNSIPIFAHLCEYSQEERQAANYDIGSLRGHLIKSDNSRRRDSLSFIIKWPISHFAHSFGFRPRFRYHMRGSILHLGFCGSLNLNGNSPFVNTSCPICDSRRLPLLI